MSQELSPAQQQQVRALLLAELRHARDAARADGATAPALAEAVDGRRQILRLEELVAGDDVLDG